MSTLAGQLFTKKMVVGDPAARSYLLVPVLLPYEVPFWVSSEKAQQLRISIYKTARSHQTLWTAQEAQGFLSILLDIFIYFV
jgi:hypothetical protein